MLRRIVEPLGRRRLRVIMRFAIISSIGLAVMEFTTHAQSNYAMRIANGPFQQNPGTPLLIESFMLTESLSFFSTILWWLAWSSLAIAALRTRAIWNASWCVQR